LVPIRRALGAILIGAYESAQRSIDAKQYGRAGWLLDIASGAAKNQADVLVEAAANFSLDGDTRQAISELKAAQKLGFHDWPKVSADDRFKNLVNKDEFRKLTTER
jgi:predicted Zn-dependent protease